MFSLLFSSVYSINVDSPGYYMEYEHNSLYSINFNLKSYNNYNYYLVFCTNQDLITYDGIKLTSRVYSINPLIYSLNIRGLNGNTLHFGVFLIPSAFNSLEICITPNKVQTFSLNKYSSYGFQKFYLLIINYDPMEVEISRGPKDYNMISYSASGYLYNNDNDINSIPKTNIIAIGYYCNRSPTNTTYKITPIKSFYTYETYQYYDSRGIPLFFFNKIDIGNFEFNDSTIAYTSHHCDLTNSQDLVFNVAKDTIIIFSRAANISATASVFGKTHSVLGKTKIKAIEYLSKGTLTLSTTSELGSCDFYTFNYSTEKCNFPIILSGEHKYYIKNLASGYKYCVFYAAAQRSVSYLVPKNLAYNRIEPDGTGADIKRSDNQSFFSPKLIVLHGDIFENKVYLAAYGSIYDDNYVIDGKNSKYSFYQISDYTFRKVNTNSKVGYTEVNNRLLIYIFVPFSIVTFIAVYLVYYFRRHRKNKDPELELLDQNNSNEAPQSNDQNDEGFTAPTYQLSTENNNLENPYY